VGMSALDRSAVQLGDRRATSRGHGSLAAAGRHEFTLIDWLILTVVLHSEAIDQWKPPSRRYQTYVD
jgi:hypothetical protein